MQPNYLFVYGLLKSIYENEAAQFIRKNCTLVGEGSFPGIMFDVGNHPGAFYDTKSGSSVYGELYQITKNRKELIALLDNFEGVGPGFKQPNEYKRELISVHTQTGIISASCYLYNWNSDRFKVITNGRYEKQTKS